MFRFINPLSVKPLSEKSDFHSLNFETRFLTIGLT